MTTSDKISEPVNDDSTKKIAIGKEQEEDISINRVSHLGVDSAGNVYIHVFYLSQFFIRL